MTRWIIHIEGIATLQDLYDKDDITFERMRDGIVKILRHRLSRYLREPNLDETPLDGILDEFAEVDSEWYCDLVLNRLYDWCDENGIWIDPIH